MITVTSFETADQEFRDWMDSLMKWFMIRKDYKKSWKAWPQSDM